MRLGFIGSGRMADAVISGLTSKRAVAKKNIIIYDKDPSRLRLVSRKYNVKAAAGGIDVVESSDVVVLAVKPQSMAAVLSEISKKIGHDRLVISIAAGITLKSLERSLPGAAVVRVMPNNPCLIGEGISLISGGKLARESHIREAEMIFSAVGVTARIDEKHMNAVTALSGSGPAFVYETLSALTDGGIEAGLTKELAKKLAERTVFGSIMTVMKTGKSPEELKNMVVSPGGTTIAGLRVLEEGGFKSMLRKAVVKAAARAREISEEFDRSL